ncbi:MAG: putative porin [Staphylococcus sp.]|nr:putative porin [Staphylococcus sp.]
MKKHILIIITILLAGYGSARAEDIPADSLSYAWRILQPLGLRERAPMDTLLYNYYQTAVPSAVSPAFATTGNQASVGKDMLFMQSEPMSDFFFRDAKRFWLPNEQTMRFFNTRIPMSQVGYNTGGGREVAQDYFRLLFSGNVNKRTQIGALVNYPYSKGSYENQAAKGFTWGLSGSYTGDRYEFQGFFNAYNMVNKENGGITDDLYILDPAQMQGGVSSINPKSIPTNLSGSTSRVAGKQFYMNHRYKVGYWHEEKDENDSVVVRDYVPVSSFIWTFNYQTSRHRFSNTNSSEEDFWTNHYIDATGTADHTEYSSIRNTLGISLLEGFNKYAKAGLGAFVTHELRSYKQTTDTLAISGVERPEGLTPYPFDSRMKGKETENLLYVGAQLVKQRGTLLNYEATASIGLVGAAAGEFKADGNVSTHIRLLGDTVTIKGYGHFSNTTAPYLMKHFISNHFAWENDFGKIRRVRFGGILDLPHTGTRVNVGAENIQNYIYFGPEMLPVQNGGSVQVFSAQLQQDFQWRALNWRNTVVYQKSSDESVLPLPQLAIYSNLFLYFRVAKVLQVQLGVDLDYYTSYYAPSYQPSTMAFYNQSEVKCGNYPFMNVYANMKLSRARFFVLFSHVNQGMFGGSNYFSMPHYPLNPRRFQMGVIVDFNN